MNLEVEHEVCAASGRWSTLCRIITLSTSLCVTALCKSIAGQAGPLAQDYTVVLHNADSEYFIDGPGLVRFDDGNLLAVVPVVPRGEWNRPRRVEFSRIHVVASADGGETWTPLANLPYYMGVPWVYENRLYLFASRGGTRFRNDDLLLLESLDRGRTWSEPLTLFKGHYWNVQTGMVFSGSQLYWAVDDLSLGSDRGPRVIVGDLSRNLMDATAWRISNPVPFPGIPPMMTKPAFEEITSRTQLEPNVIDVRGRLRVLTTVKLRRQTAAGLAGVLDINDDGDAVDLVFSNYSAMPGGQLKFSVIYDEVSELFWATGNLVVDSEGVFDWWEKGANEGSFQGFAGGNDRRLLMLLYSLNGLDWFQAGCIAQAGRISQSFMYATPVIDGEDLAVIVRASISAPNQHDADYATFHRVRNFRSLALRLTPELE